MTEALHPQHDWIFLERLQYDDLTAGGIHVARPGDYEHLKTEKERRASAREPGGVDPGLKKAMQNRVIERYNVIAVGPGAYVDFSDELHDDVFLRKPVCCKPGDVVLVQGEPPTLPVNGQMRHMAHDYQVMAIIVNAGTADEDLDPQHDYIFARERAEVLTSAGGVFLAGVSDKPGAVRVPQRFEALGVGAGPWAICETPGKPTRFERRPMCVAPKDVFIFEGVGFGITTGRWGSMVVVQNYQVAAKFVEVA